MFRPVFLLLGAAFGTVAQAAPRDPAYPEQVQVRFENLSWVGAKTVLPRIASGQVIVPVAEACDLLGLDCTIGKDTLSTNGQSFPISQGIVINPENRQIVPLTALAPLVRAAGQSIGWNQAARVATVYGGTGSQGWRAVSAMFRAAPEANPYHGPLRASQTAPKMGQPAVQQVIFAETPLGQVTFFSKTADALTVVGSLNPSTPDNPNRVQPCHANNPRVCELPVPRDALWVLAYATAK